MDTNSFNNLLNRYYHDKAARRELCQYCLKIINRKLQNDYPRFPDLEDIARDILYYFLKHIPLMVFAPFKYLNRCVVNYMASNYKCLEETLPLKEELSYEQVFTKLDETELMNFLEEHLNKRAATIIYKHCVDGVKEKDLAEEMNLSYPNVRAIVSRGTKKLKEILSGCNKSTK